MLHYCECPMCPSQGEETDKCGCSRETNMCDRICTLEAELLHHVNRANRLQAEREALVKIAVRATIEACVTQIDADFVEDEDVAPQIVLRRIDPAPIVRRVLGGET